MARRLSGKYKVRPHMKGDTPDMFTKLQPKKEKKHTEHTTHKCDVCGVDNASFGSNDGWLCGDHWRLTAYYQWLMFREFFELMEDDDG